MSVHPLEAIPLARKRETRKHEALRALPQLHKLLELPQAAVLCDRFRRKPTVDAVREELSQLRERMLAGESSGADAASPAFFEAVEQRLRKRQAPGLRRVVNATGVVLHTNLGRAPLAPEALAAISDLAGGYCNLEYDLPGGSRGSRHEHVQALLCRLTGAEAALVVNNCAAAVLLALMALARDGEVIVSRGELIEIGGSFRMPDVIAQSGAVLVEVGTTNKTRIEDYERAIGPRTRLILRSHPSNYRVVGFTAQPARAELAALARRHQLPLLEDLGSGTLVDLRRFGLPDEPTVQACVREGGGLVAFSGDKLLGGPQAGVIAGPAALVQALRSHPLHRALRIDKLSLAALEATLRLYDDSAPPESRVPALRMLAQTPAEIARRARVLARRLRRELPGLECNVCAGESLAGGGSLPEACLPTTLIVLAMRNLTAAELSSRLRAATPAVVGRIVADRYAIDLRTVAPAEVALVVAALAQVARCEAA
jgi:L-seryl-tRNA(Ser) seleniumtransferase